MTVSKRSILSIPIPVLRACPESTIADLREVVNDGYDKQVVKYNIVQTPRVHFISTFFANLGLTDDRCLLYVMIDSVEDIGGSPEYITELGDYKLYDIKESAAYNFSRENVKATLAYRPWPKDQYPGSFEITGYTSFDKGCGLQLFNSTLSTFKKTYIDCEKIVIKVIYEHDLVPYYEKKLNFVEIGRSLVKKSETKEAGFEDFFTVGRDIHVCTMERVI